MIRWTHSSSSCCRPYSMCSSPTRESSVEKAQRSIFSHSVTSSLTVEHCLLSSSNSGFSLYAVMSSLFNATKAALVFLSAAGYYTTWYFIFNNGTIDHVAHVRKLDPQLLPGTKEPVRTVYTGVPAIDHQLTFLTLFFWEIVNGSHPSASLFSFYFATQVASGWGLLVIEGLRPGNRWSLVSL